MPALLTYPGVYVEEISSGVRSITGVATSITAFIGRALKGPNEPILINSFSDFQRIFGGLWALSPLGYAVNDFYLNGGGQAIIVRLFHHVNSQRSKALIAANCTPSQIPATITNITENIRTNAIKSIENDLPEALLTSVDLTTIQSDINGAVDTYTAENDKTQATYVGNKISQKAAQYVDKPIGECLAAIVDVVNRINKEWAGALNPLKLEAANEGSWANNLGIRVTYPDAAVAKEAIKSLGLDKYNVTENDLFNIIIRNNETGETETFQNLTVTDSPRRVTEVLENESKLLRVMSLPVLKPDKHADVPQKDNTIWDINDPPTFSGVSDSSKAQDGGSLEAADYTKESAGMDLLNKVDIFNLLCIPLDTSSLITDFQSVYQKAMKLCADRRAMLIVDPLKDFSGDKLSDLGLTGPAARNAALYFPRLIKEDPLRGRQQRTFAPCGAIAGVIARTDSQRGVWKAPAGVDAAVNGITGLDVNLNDAENGMLNPLGINCLRSFPVYGSIIWGARTLRGADQLGDEYKYIPVRRMALYIEESLFRGLKWVVFEPNNESLWAQIRLNVGAFMHNLFRQGAFQGTTPQKAYFVKCDKETTTQDDINKGIVNIVVGFAPLKPAEFVVIKIQQMAGDIQA